MNSEDKKTQEVTLQVRFPVEVLKNVEWSASTTIFGGELVAIDFDGELFREWQERREREDMNED